MPPPTRRRPPTAEATADSPPPGPHAIGDLETDDEGLQELFLLAGSLAECGLPQGVGTLAEAVQVHAHVRYSDTLARSLGENWAITVEKVAVWFVKIERWYKKRHALDQMVPLFEGAPSERKELTAQGKRYFERLQREYLERLLRAKKSSNLHDLLADCDPYVASSLGLALFPWCAPSQIPLERMSDVVKIDDEKNIESVGTVVEEKSASGPWAEKVRRGPGRPAKVLPRISLKDVSDADKAMAENREELRREFQTLLDRIRGGRHPVLPKNHAIALAVSGLAQRSGIELIFDGQVVNIRWADVYIARTLGDKINVYSGVGFPQLEARLAESELDLHDRQDISNEGRIEKSR